MVAWPASSSSQRNAGNAEVDALAKAAIANNARNDGNDRVVSCDATPAVVGDTETATRTDQFTMLDDDIDPRTGADVRFTVMPWLDEAQKEHRKLRVQRGDYPDLDPKQCRCMGCDAPNCCSDYGERQIKHPSKKSRGDWPRCGLWLPNESPSPFCGGSKGHGCRTAMRLMSDRPVLSSRS